MFLQSAYFCYVVPIVVNTYLKTISKGCHSQLCHVWWNHCYFFLDYELMFGADVLLDLRELHGRCGLENGLAYQNYREMHFAMDF